MTGICGCAGAQHPDAAGEAIANRMIRQLPGQFDSESHHGHFGCVAGSLSASVAEGDMNVGVFAAIRPVAALSGAT